MVAQLSSGIRLDPCVQWRRVFDMLDDTCIIRFLNTDDSPDQT